MGKPKVPDTIPPQEAGKLKAAAGKQPWFTRQAVARRKGWEKQRKNAGKS
jgi:hypothetical protein